jgi:hypothetical protein
MRITACQSNLLYVGLRQIILNHLTLKNTGHCPGSHPDLLTVRFLGRRGTFNKEKMEAIYHLWKTLLDNRGQEFRLSLDYAQTAACALAVRTTVRQLRHGHITPWTDGIQSIADYLLQRLEALRKRLKRKIIKSQGQGFFRDLAGSWRAHLTWVRLNLLVCRCVVRYPNPFYRSQQRLIDDMCRVTRAELQKRGFKMPSDQIFRKLVRDGLKNVRRYRTPFTQPLLRRNPQIADWWFAEYVIRRLDA